MVNHVGRLTGNDTNLKNIKEILIRDLWLNTIAEERGGRLRPLLLNFCGAARRRRPTKDGFYFILDPKSFILGQCRSLLHEVLDTTWQSSQIHSEKIRVLGALSAQNPYFFVKLAKSGIGLG
jgi:hypothetical protein